MAKNIRPIIYEKTSNGEEVYDIYSRLMTKERILFLGSSLDIEVANDIISQMLWLDKQETSPIFLYINCYGGDTSAMFSIYDVMQYVSSHVHTFVLGEAASAAAVILSAGEKGYRYGLPNCEIMIHEPQTGFDGSASDMKVYQENMSKIREKMLKILALHSGKTYKKIARDCSRDFFLSAKQALEYGIIDSILEPTKK